MMIHVRGATVAAALALLCFTALTVRADVASPPPPPPARSSVATVPLAPPDNHEQAREMQRARFSGKRLLVEILVGGAVGSAIAYGTFEALCDEGGDCFGAGIAGWAANFAVTPVAVWGTGQLMGGRGRLLYSYLGASPALAPFSVTGSVDETPAEALSRLRLQIALSTVFLPICSALLYEASSHVTSVQWTREHAPSLAVRPLYGRDRVEGAMGMLSLQF